MKIGSLSGSLTRLADDTSYLIAGTNITIVSESNGAITISSTGGGGGGGGDDFFDSTTAGSIFTSGSAAFVGVDEFGVVDSPVDKGTDVFFYVSGAIDSRGTAIPGVALFGGDVVVSGSLTIPSEAIEITGSLLVTGRVEVTGTLEATQGLSGSLTNLVDGTSYLIAGTNITITSQSNGSITISNSFVQADDFFDSTTAGSIFTSGSVAFVGVDEFGVVESPLDKAADVFFYVSGSIGSKHTSVAGTALFGGDVTVSGSFYTDGNLLEVQGKITATEGISGSLTQLTDGTSYLIAGTNITITSQSNGSITISNSFVQADDFFDSTTAGSIFTSGSAAFVGVDEFGVVDSPVDKGTDVFFYVSGAIGSKDSATPGVALFGGDLVVSGSVFAEGDRLEMSGTLSVTEGISGSLTQLTDGTSYIIAGTNITVTSQSNGSITIDGSTQAPVNASYLVLGSDSTLTSERTFTPGTGLLGSDAGANSTYTLDINDSIVATVSGTTFTGVTKHNAGLSGSLTRLTDDTSYLIAGTNISITTGSNGSITIDNTFTQADDFFDSTTAGSIYTTGSAAFKGQESIDSPDDKGTDVFFYVSGTIGSKGTTNTGVALFGGDLVVSGSMYTEGDRFEMSGTLLVTEGISGSLTQLIDGTSYLIAGTNISITSQSNGAVTISNTFVQADDFFDSTTAGSIFTTGSAAFRGEESAIDSPSDKGSDVFFYVSGSTLAARTNVSVFGGTVVISGSMIQGNFDVSGGTTAKFARAHGERTSATGESSHAEGRFALAQGQNSHAEGDSTAAIGAGSHAEGLDSYAYSNYSHAEGRATKAQVGSTYSHAEGEYAYTYAESSHAEGERTVTNTNAKWSHAEGSWTQTTGKFSHAEGTGSIAYGDGSHAQGYFTHASGTYSLAAGVGTIASGSGQVVVGNYNLRDNVDSLFIVGNGTGDLNANRSDILRVNSGDVQITGSILQTNDSFDGNSIGFMGNNTGTPADLGPDIFFYVSGSGGGKGGAIPKVALFGGDVVISGTLHGGSPLKIGTDTQITGSLSQGLNAVAFGAYSQAQGTTVRANDDNAHAEGDNTLADAVSSHAEGSYTTAFAGGAHSEGFKTYAFGLFSHAEGHLTTGSGDYSHAEGGPFILEEPAGVFTNYSCIANANYSHVEGLGSQTSITAVASHAEGFRTIATGSYSHTEGDRSISRGDYSHSEGSNTISIGAASHAEGESAIAEGIASHAEGLQTKAYGDYSHAAGLGTVASGSYQMAIGKYNVGDSSTNTLFIIGDGTSTSARANALKVTTTTADFDVEANFNSAADFDQGTTAATSGSSGVSETSFPIRLRYRSGTNYYTWAIGIDSGLDLNFSYGGIALTPPPTLGAKGRLQNNVDVGTIDFTGQHRCIPDGLLSDYTNKIGMIVKSTGAIAPLSGSAMSINDAIPVISLTSKRNDKSCFGVISEIEDEESSDRTYKQGVWVTVYEKKSETDNRVYVNSLGEGCIWICNINGDLENGDYITTCEIPGYGMKQDDDLLHNYTVAKSTMSCNFDLNSTTYRCEEFVYNGITYKKAFIACTYHCG